MDDLDDLYRAADERGEVVPGQRGACLDCGCHDALSALGLCVVCGDDSYIE